MMRSQEVEWVQPLIRTLRQGHLISSLQIASLWAESSHEKIGGFKIWETFHKTPNIQLKKSSYAGFTFHSNNGPELWSSRPF